MKTNMIGGSRKSGIFFVLIILFLFSVSLATLNTSNASTPLYVNGSSGDDKWDGTSPVYVSGDVGPMQTITTALKAVDDDGTVNVAEGTYNEALFIDRNLNLIGNGASNSRITAPDPSDNIITITSDSKVTISGFTIQGALSGTGINLQGGSVTLTDNNLIENQNGITIDGAKATITENNIQDNQLGINISSGAVPEVIRINFNRITKNEIDIYTEVEGINGQYNWWGDNNDPKIKVTGVVTSPWLYMTISANLTLILNGGTSQITGSFNNAYDGSTITVLDPAHGHLPDECEVTFTTDLGSVGNGNTINGTTTVTFTANEGTGTAHLAAQLDTQIVNTNVGIETLYVNANTGNDEWDGTSPIYISGTTGPMKTIQTAINTINSGGTVYVATGTYYEHLNINKNLNLIGDNRDSTIVDGTSTGRSLNIGAADVEISNLTIKNGNVTGNGGGIFSLATLTINNCAITGNTATSNGGGIYAAGTIIINNSIIAGNTATNGGGIGYGWNTMTIRYSRLANNTATFGREIYLISGTIDAQYNWWGENSGPQAGQISGTVIYTPWLFMVFLADPTVILRGETSNLTANLNNAFDGSTLTPLDPAMGHLADGCRITFSTDLGSVGSYTTIKNTSNGVATAILTADGEAGVANVSVLFDSKYITRPITIIDKRYVNNATGNDTWDGSSPTYINGTKGPMKTIQTAIAAINNDGTISVAGGTYTEYIDIDKNLHLMGVDPSTTIIENTNYLGRVSGNIIVNIENFTIRNNLGSYGVIELYDSKLTLNNCVITDNWVSDQGGAIINHAGNLIITNSILSGNTAGYEDWSYSYSMGGVIFNDNGRVNITNCTFTNNTAHYGGVIYSNGGKVTIANSIFTFNKAINGEETTDGGVIYNNQGLVTIMDCTFTSNTATSGGAIYNIGKLTITNSTLTQNYATTYGGSIYIAPDSSLLNTINIFNSLLTENTASVGAVLYMDFDPVTTGTVNIINSVITGNHADFGALYVSRGTLNINNSTITNNTVTSNGGVIYNSINGLVNVNDSNLSGNTARDGGALYNQGVVNIINSSLSENTATNGDGGVVMNLGTVNVLNSNLSKNIARNGEGGAVYSISGGINITDSIISSNNATISDGGAIKISSGTLNINNSTLINNTCGNNGGAININLATVNITGSTLYGNTAINSGGAIYNEGSTINMHFNRIAGNTPETITNYSGVIFAENNWWGTNSNPYSQFAGFVNYSPWLYMTFTADPAIILEGSACQLIASFNHAYDGADITFIDPTEGHLPDGSQVTFTTDLGSVGSQTTTKNTTDGIASAKFTADGGTGISNISAQLDNQKINITVVITDITYVNRDLGNDSWDGTSPVHINSTVGPKMTIQNAVNSLINGGTINVASGTYSENLVLVKKYNLLGTDSANTILTPADAGSNVIFVNGGAQGSTICGFNITGAVSAAGIMLKNVNNTLIYNIIISTNTIGISFDNACNNTVNNIQLANNGAALQIYHSNLNHISNCTFTSNDYGVYLLEGNNNTVVYSNFTVTTINGRAFYLESGQGNQINNNTITGGVYGIESLNDYQNNYSDNNISFSNWRNLYLINPVQDILSNNHIHHTINGLLILGGSDNQLTNNTLNNCGSGLEIANSLRNHLIANNVSENTFGIYLYSDSGTIISQNNVSNCGSGIELHESSENTINYNNFTQNTFGTYVASGTQNNIENNLFYNTLYGGAGVHFDNTSDNVLNNNSFTSDVKDFRYGIYINQGSNNNITVNNVSNNHAGLELHNTNMDQITGNILSFNTVGLFMDSASENFFTTNSINNNGAGVEMHDSHQNTFINFNIANCTFGFIIFNGSNNNIMNSIFDNNGAAINLQTCTYTNVDNNQMNNNSYGVYLFEGDHNIVQGLQVTDIKLDGSGVFLDGSEQNTVKKNSFINSEKIFTYGIYQTDGGSNVLESNIAIRNHAGIELHNTNGNWIRSNSLSYNTLGVFIWGGEHNNLSDNLICDNGAGIELHRTTQINLKGNNLTSNVYGLYSDQLTGSKIIANNLISNTIGVYSFKSSGNEIYSNTFDSNNTQAYDSGTNNWDNGVDTGNCWSDYDGNGVYGILGGSNIDHYPKSLHS